MAVQILSRRSSTLYDRPFPIRLGSGELAVNNNNGEPGLYFAEIVSSDGLESVIKIVVGH